MIRGQPDEVSEQLTQTAGHLKATYRVDRAPQGEREGTTRLSGIAKEFLAKVASGFRDSNRTHSCIDEFSESVTLELMSKSRAATQPGLIPLEVIERRIYFIRTHKVMLDSDLAELYGENTARENAQEKRNIHLFHAFYVLRLINKISECLISLFRA